ncbi:MAG: ABC transporter permease [Acidobacteriaceae bacterium]|nr:ABC transporter permease [Acidobacteriaceae bacterium]MBV9296799.1 ABC transporter permease [Acidobacteriaceae bacterium]MBV9765635.1 ABC transporter permease [Acidobacteriaceae bacterium]
MTLLAYLHCVVSKVLRRSQIDGEMEEELRSHVQHRADDLERSGLNRATAERRARIEFGAHGRFKEECREALGGNLIETAIQDLRLSVRTLRKSPAFAIVAVLTVALAISANAIVFGVLNALILRPLNLPEAESLYALQRADDKFGNESYANYRDLRDRNRSFHALAAYTVSQAGLDTGYNPSRALLYQVSGNYFEVLGVRPYLGRLIHSSDEHGANSAPYIVLTYAYWQTHFQHDRGVVGRTVQLNKHPFTIIGVAPPGFRGTLLIFSPDFFVPIVNQEQIDGESRLNARGNRLLLSVMGHLKADVTPAQAIADLNFIGSDLQKSYPKDEGRLTFLLARLGLGSDVFDRPIRAFVSALMVLAVLILLASCANLGGLFAARAADRTREVALRLALGAGRIRIARTLFTEALLVSLLGGAAGLWASVVLLHSLSTWQPFPEYPMNIPVNPDATVYGIALLLSLASGFLFGAVPVRQALHTDPYDIVKSGLSTTNRRRITIRDLLITAQITICALLVTFSIVAVRGLIRSLHSNFGFEPRNALLVGTDLSMAGYSGDAAPAMQRRMIDATRAIPGVTSVGLVGQYPPLHLGWNDADVFTDKTTDLRPANAAADAILYGISPDYFPAAGTALLMGRSFTWGDDKDSPPVAVVNREFAKKVFGSATTAMGSYYKMRAGKRIQVLGIVEDGKYTASLTETAQPAMFLPILQLPSSETSLVVRSSRDPQQLSADIRTALRKLDPGVPSLIQTWGIEMDGALFAPRMATMSLGVLGVLGAMLSITGIFGMAAYSVSKRLKELGIRMALGARREEVLQAALGRPLKLLAFGSAAGLILGILASRVLASIVYQATPRDPLVLSGVVLVMALLGLLATWIPAQRILSLDPMTLLREE